MSKIVSFVAGAAAAITTWVVVDQPKDPPEPVPAEPLALVGEFAAVLNAPDVTRWYTPNGGFYMRSDSMATEWEMRKIDPPWRPFQRIYLSQGVAANDAVEVFDLAPNDTLVLQLPQGDWYLAVEDTAYGLSGFQKFVADPCDSLSCFDYPPSVSGFRAGPEPVYAMLGGRESNLRFPVHEVDYIYYDRVAVRHIGEGNNYLRFGAFDVATKSWVPYGGLVQLAIMPCGWTPPPPPVDPPSGVGPELSRAWFVNDWTLRFAFEDSLGSESSSIDPATVEPSDIVLTKNGVPVTFTSVSFHWGWYFSANVARQESGAWRFKIKAGAVADTLGVTNAVADSVEWIEP